MKDWPENVNKEDKIRGKYGCKFMTLCPGCGKKRYVTSTTINTQLKQKRIVGCCKHCTLKVSNHIIQGKDHWSWKGGKQHASMGYIWIKICDEHPYAIMRNLTSCIPEHRLIMAQHLGRVLLSEELVHHKNGNRQDNKLENLEVMTRSEHSTQHMLEKLNA